MNVEQAAGVLCWRRARDGLEVLLVHRPRYDDWSWPKGKVKGGEPLPQTAVREAAEETGLRVVLGRPLGEVRYRLPEGGSKHVAYWAATASGRAPADEAAAGTADGGGTATGTSEGTRDGPGAAAVDLPMTPPPEVDATAWLPVSEARALLTRHSDEGPLDLLEGYERDGELATFPVVVLRHGKARPRDSWDGADADRPLAPAGRRQSRGLVALLPCWVPERLVSSPWRRCLETLAPFAEAAGLEVRTKNALSEEGARRSPNRLRRHVRRALQRGHRAVLCTHRPVLETVFDVVRAACEPEATADVPTKDPYLAPGEVLVAHVVLPGALRTRVVAVERHQPAS